ncbi:MAG: YidC/Oxa1 family membrane protein insertase [Candidatus Taylorbacteria bacterium]|nr:YidC/Oxa1 family membrane protein insertase [Candidatus Taylorbacteria bacterium]
MFSYLYHSIVFDPLYNGLIFLFDVFPWIDAGFAVIIFTIIVRLILFPLSKKSIVTQVRMKEIEPELNKLKQTVTDKQQQALKVMELYRKKGINPFSSFLLLLLQLPIIWALYHIFVNSGLPIVNSSLLYGFVNIPTIDMSFLGIFDINVRSVLLSIVAAIAQYLQLHFSLASVPPTPGEAPNPISDMMKNMKYIFPVMIFLFSFSVSAVVPIYWTVSSLFTLGQELVVRRHLRRREPL